MSLSSTHLLLTLTFRCDCGQKLLVKLLTLVAVLPSHHLCDKRQLELNCSEVVVGRGAGRGGDVKNIERQTEHVKSPSCQIK